MKIHEIEQEIARLEKLKQEIKNFNSANVQKFIEQHKISESSLDIIQYWDIFGEDPNCDYGGYHHEPLLETVHGKLIDVIKYAVELNSFFTWGRGGRICKSSFKEIKRL